MTSQSRMKTRPTTPDIRPGEIAVALPDQTRRRALFHRPHPHALEGAQGLPEERPRIPRTGAVCTIELDPRWAPALHGVETCSHLIVLYWMDQARRDLVVQVPRPLRRPAAAPLRCARRCGPTRSRMSVVKLREGRGHAARRWSALDCLDGTPLLDIKPYFASTDCDPGRRGRLARRRKS